MKAEARFMPLRSFARTFSTLLTIVAFGLGRRVSARLVPANDDSLSHFCIDQI
jgi:hypothetical protein